MFKDSGIRTLTRPERRAEIIKTESQDDEVIEPRPIMNDEVREIQVVIKSQLTPPREE
jgi:hypothetical protein